MSQNAITNAITSQTTGSAISDAITGTTVPSLADYIQQPYLSGHIYPLGFSLFPSSTHILNLRYRTRYNNRLKISKSFLRKVY